MIGYFHRVALRFGLSDKIQLNKDVSELRWIEDDHEWELTLLDMIPGTGDLSEAERKQKIATEGMNSVYRGKRKLRARIVISCTGILVEPNAWLKNNVYSSQSFQGDIMHCARWKDNVDFRNKRVAVIGSGCSAAQVVPSLLKEPFAAKSVTQIMRSPPYVMPRLEEPFGKENFAKYAPTVLQYLPVLGQIYRTGMYWLVELIWMTVFQEKNIKWRSAIEKSTLKRTFELIPPKYEKTMTPDYSYGCKRRVFDNEWLKSMNNSNFCLTTRPLLGLREHSLLLGPSPCASEEDVAKDRAVEEVQLDADIVVLATGYDAARWIHPLKVHGRGDKAIQDIWQERGGPQAYMGTAMDGFPNFFIAPGPNTANGHGSLIFISEAVTKLILQVAKPVLRGDAVSVEPKPEAAQRWTRELHKDLAETVFVGCHSWYQDANGWNSTMYP